MWCKLKKKIQYLMSMVINIGVVFRYGKKIISISGINIRGSSGKINYINHLFFRISRATATS